MQPQIQLKGLALSDESSRLQFLQRKTPARKGFTALFMALHSCQPRKGYVVLKYLRQSLSSGQNRQA